MTAIADETGKHLAFAVVVIAASAGGIEALREVIEHLPRGFPVPVIVLQHLSPHHPSALPHILAQHSALEVKKAQAGETLKAGVVYVAPPDYHLVLNVAGQIELNQDDRVQYVRPSADLLFKSAARHFGQRVIAVVLSGSGRDGAEGVDSVSRAGGMVIAQDSQARFGSMPRAAIATDCVDLILPLKRIAPELEALAVRGVSDE